jgi:hypothetical protein
MNCQSCNSGIYYRFLTRCSHCDTVIGPSQVPTKDSVKNLCLAKPAAKTFSWSDGVINFAYVAISSIAGMFTGAIVLYLGAAIVYITFVGPSGNDSHDCARGTAVAMMSIFLGALLGLTAGIVLSASSLPRRPAV